MNQARVDVVEDDHGVCTLLRHALEREGRLLVFHHSAAQFMDEYDPAIPGCLILDVKLPDLNGIELLRRARDRGWWAPAIILTAFADVVGAVSSMKSGALDYLEKPFDPLELVRKVDEAIALDIQTRRRQSEQTAIRERFAELSSRERELVGLVIAGQSNKQIAMVLGIAFKTVINHRASLMAKVGALNAADLVRLALAAGFRPDTRAAPQTHR